MAKKNKFKKQKKKNKNNPAPLEELKTMGDYFDRVNSSRKCQKAKEYLDKFVNDKDYWKFNVRKLKKYHPSF